MITRDNEFCLSSNGDRWQLLRDEDAGSPYVLHLANRASGGTETRHEISDFLKIDIGSPQHTALMELIGTLAEPSAEEAGKALARLMLGTRH